MSDGFDGITTSFFIFTILMSLKITNSGPHSPTIHSFE